MSNPLPKKPVYSCKQQVSLTTPQAHRTLKRLCTHFQHKVEVHWSADNALIYFDEGVCAMSAQEQQLYLCCEAHNAHDLTAITDTMGRHILGFCRDESFTMTWCDVQ